MKGATRPGWLLSSLGSVVVAFPALLLRLPHRVPRLLRVLLLLLLLLGPLLAPRVGSPTDRLAAGNGAARELAPSVLWSDLKDASGKTAGRQKDELYALVPAGSMVEAAADLDDQVLLLVRHPREEDQRRGSASSPGATAVAHPINGEGGLPGWCVFGEGPQQQLTRILGAGSAPTPGLAYLRCALPEPGPNGNILSGTSVPLSVLVPRDRSSVRQRGRAGKQGCPCLCRSPFLVATGRGKPERRKGNAGKRDCRTWLLRGALPGASKTGSGPEPVDGTDVLDHRREGIPTLPSCASLVPRNATGHQQQWPRFVYDSVLQAPGLYLFVKGLRKMEPRGRHNFVRSIPGAGLLQNATASGPVEEPLHRRKLGRGARSSSATLLERGPPSDSSTSGAQQLGSPGGGGAEQWGLNVTCVYGDCWEAPAIDGALELVLCPLPPPHSNCWAHLRDRNGKPRRTGVEGSAECGLPVTVRTKEGELVPSLASFTGEPMFPMHWRMGAMAPRSHPKGQLGVSMQQDAAGGAIPEEAGAGQRAERLSETDGVAASRKGSEVEAKQHHVCACTMVYDVAKFLPEWLLYHSWMGVERFFLYDNNSGDKISRVTSTLTRPLRHDAGGWPWIPGSPRVQDGLNVSVHAWPWLKSQQAGFSHCLLRAAPICTWVLFADVDEFVRPRFLADLRSQADVAALVSKQGPLLHYLMRLVHDSVHVALEASGLSLGQLCLQCYEFGPSGHRQHPVEGVTVGYTSRRRRAFRHKCMVRPEAVHNSLYTRVHEFELKPGWVSNTDLKQGKERLGWLNHYKYQAWAEFKAKFRRRVATQVHDWTAQGAREAEERARRKGFAAARAMKDREPILSTAGVEPHDWVNQFGERNDTDVRSFVLLVFQHSGDGAGGGTKMLWQTD